MRLHLELLVLALEDIDTQRQNLQSDQHKYISMKDLLKVQEAMNKARYYLQQLAALIQKSS
jgi:hypothetical protein